MPVASIDNSRLHNYERYRLIYRSKHKQVFNGHSRILDGDEQFPPIVVNIGNAIIDGLTGLIVSDSPKFTLEGSMAAQKALDEVLQNCSFSTELNQHITQGMLYGDSLFKVFNNRQGQVTIRTVSPKNWIAIPDPQDADSYLEHILFSTKMNPNTNIKYLHQESHTAGQITNTFWKIDADGSRLTQITKDSAVVLAKAPEWSELEEVEATGVDEPLVIPWCYDKLPGEVYGTSEYETIMDLILATDQRSTQIDRVLAKHADPKVMVSEEMITRDENGNIVIPSLDVIIKPSGSDKESIGYVTWDGKLTDARAAVEAYIEQQLLVTQTSRLLLNADGSSAQTGEALKIQLYPSMVKASMIQKSMANCLRTTIRVVQKKLNAESKKFKVSPVIINWGVKIPDNIQSQVQAQAQAVEAGLTSPEQASENITTSPL